jgi:leader peptidase (prepilin peptidase)/N-methyltransferase
MAGLVVGGSLLGLVVGSFVNVVAHRVPRGISAITPRSRCPACLEPIQARDNIPVASWLILRGRCRNCRSPISVRYPIVEAGTAAVFGLLAGSLGAVWVLPAFWWFAGVSITLTLTDLDTKRIPNRILLPGVVVGLVALGAGALGDGDPGAFLRGLAGGGSFFAFLLVLALAVPGGFGFGDVKLGFFLGVFLAFRSWEALWVGTLGGFGLGGVTAVVLLALRRVKRKDHIPFGPAMVAGAFVGVLAGDQIARWYLG